MADRLVVNLNKLEISEMKVVPCINSPYIRPSRVEFKQVNVVLFLLASVASETLIYCIRYVKSHFCLFFYIQEWNKTYLGLHKST